MDDRTYDLSTQEFLALDFARTWFGPRWFKAKLRQCWETGTWPWRDHLTTETLKSLRNVRGPSWLNEYDHKVAEAKMKAGEFYG